MDAPLLYDARDLATHALCVGMTGSGNDDPGRRPDPGHEENVDADIERHPIRAG